MTLQMWYVNSSGDLVQGEDILPDRDFEVVQEAAEGSVGSSTLILSDPTGTFYIPGHKLIYFIETDAVDDDWRGIIGPFYAGKRRVRRGVSERTGAARVIEIELRDANTLWTRRVQKGTDSKRPVEDHTTRRDWLFATAEVTGSVPLEDVTTYVFDDTTAAMSESDYTGQDSAGVVNDLLQQSGANAYLINLPDADNDIRIGAWYGRTRRTEFSSIHRISNDLAVVSAEARRNFDGDVPDLETPYTFWPSLDASLERDPDRTISGALVTWDGGAPVYRSRPATAEKFTQRDMAFQAELVKSATAAGARADRYTLDQRDEDDAIAVAVRVPAKLVHAFVQGHRVQVKFIHMEPEGYADDFVWMRVAACTIRRVRRGQGQAHTLYELALDLRGEEPPSTTNTAVCDGPPGVAYPATPSGTYYPLGGSGNTPNLSDGPVYYGRAGLDVPIEPTDDVLGGLHFPAYGAGGSGTTDYAGDSTHSFFRFVAVGGGTLEIQTATYSGSARNVYARVQHFRYGEGETEGVTITDETTTPVSTGSVITVDVSTHGGANCIHWIELRDVGDISGGKFGASSWDWTSSE